MFKRSLFTLLAALSLAGALTAQAAPSAPSPPPVTIPSLPFLISAPGTYVLASDLTLTPSPVFGSGAIGISTLTPGPVVIDLKGHTITGPGLNNPETVNNSTGVFLLNSGSSNRYPITIKNGTFSNFQKGVFATNGIFIGINNFTIESIIFNIVSSDIPGVNQSGSGVTLEGANNCNVSNCTFNAVSTNQSGSSGISDFDPLGGNTYTNNTFNGPTSPFSIGTSFDSGITNLVLDVKYSPPKKK